MASRFWVGGTGTWDSSTTTHWASSSGGAGGQSVPGSADAVTFDGSSGGGTVTVNFGGTITVQSIACGAFTGTLDFSANNNSVTLAGSSNPLNPSGSGVRTFNMGSGTWTFTGTGSLISFLTTTNLTFSGANAALVFTATSASQRILTLSSGLSFGAVTINANTSGGSFTLNNNTATFASLSVVAPNYVLFPGGATLTITGALNITGSSTNQVGFETSATGAVATVSSANNGTFTWCAFREMTFTGGGTFTATNSFNLGHNSGITITAPSAGGGGGLLVNPGMTGGIHG